MIRVKRNLHSPSSSVLFYFELNLFFASTFPRLLHTASSISAPFNISSKTLSFLWLSAAHTLSSRPVFSALSSSFHTLSPHSGLLCLLSSFCLLSILLFQLTILINRGNEKWNECSKLPVKQLFSCHSIVFSLYLLRMSPLRWTFFSPSPALPSEDVSSTLNLLLPLPRSPFPTLSVLVEPDLPLSQDFFLTLSLFHPFCFLRYPFWGCNPPLS